MKGYLALDLFNNLDREKPITALCVLKGGYQYFVDVMKYLKQFCATMGNRAVQINVEFIRLKSYEGKLQILLLHVTCIKMWTCIRMVFRFFTLDEEAKDEVQVIGADDLSTLKGRNVIVVEDIVDTGNTMRKLMNVLSKFEPASVKGLIRDPRTIRCELMRDLFFTDHGTVRSEIQISGPQRTRKFQNHGSHRTVPGTRIKYRAKEDQFRN